MTNKLFATEAESKAYESGYQDGESSGYADWLMAVSDEFDLGDDAIDGPAHFLRLLRERYEIKKRAV